MFNINILFLFNIMEDLLYLLIKAFILGAFGDLLFNYMASSSNAEEGAIAGLRDFYKTIHPLSAMFYAGIIFVAIVALSYNNTVFGITIASTLLLILYYYFSGTELVNLKK